MRRIREPSRLFRPVRAFNDVMSGRGGEGENSLPGLSGLLGLQGSSNWDGRRGQLKDIGKHAIALERFQSRVGC